MTPKTKAELKEWRRFGWLILLSLSIVGLLLVMGCDRKSKVQGEIVASGQIGYAGDAGLTNVQLQPTTALPSHQPSTISQALHAAAVVAPTNRPPPAHWVSVTWTGPAPDAVLISTNMGKDWFVPKVYVWISANELQITNIPSLPVAVQIGRGGQWSNKVLFRGNYSIVTVTNNSQSSDDLENWKTYASARVFNQTNTTGRQFFRSEQSVYWDSKPTYVIAEALP